MAEDIALLREQVERCRGILAKLSSLQDEDAGLLGQLTLRLLIEEGGRAAAALRRALRDHHGGREAGAGLPAQSGHDLRARQHRRQRGRFRQRDGQRSLPNGLRIRSC